MSDFDSLREDLGLAVETMRRMVEGAGATLALVTSVRDRHDAELAELRDDLVALANRVESLTRARLTEPAEVAEKVMPLTTGLARYMREHGREGKS